MPHVGSLVAVRDILICRSCLGQTVIEIEAAEFQCGDGTVNVEDRFYYFENMLTFYGSMSETVVVRIGIPWKKFSRFATKATKRNLKMLCPATSFALL